MFNILMKILILIIAYLIGSIPWGLIIGFAKGIDIRKSGSGNIGATNTGRVLGHKRYSVYVYLLDMFKGAIIVFLFKYNILPYEWCLINPMLYGLAAVIGHVFPIYLKFKGGKAVACGSGAIAGYFPIFLLFAIPFFFIILIITKYVSLSSLISSFVGLVSMFIFSIISEGLLLPLNVFYILTDIGNPIWPFNFWFIIFGAIIVVIIFIKHKSNIKRLINGTELKALQKKESQF